mgnify:CR=1 FL=1
MENIDITSQKPIIPSCLHWYNSSNILCNYMREVDYLKLILDNQAIIPRYVIEPLDYLSIPKLERIAFPILRYSFFEGHTPYDKLWNIRNRL